MFEAEASVIVKTLGSLVRRIDHVGSTAVLGLAAKPVIDLQVSVQSLEQIAAFLPRLAALGYAHVPLGDFDRVYPFFQKPELWPSTHHVHLCVEHGELEKRHLLFRDRLRANPALAAAYLTLKRKLASENHGATLESREQYSLGKSAFVASVLAERP